MSPNYTQFEMDVVERLARIEEAQKNSLVALNDHIEWSNKKSSEIDAKVAEYDAFNTRLKTIGSLLAFLWVAAQGWVLHKLGFK